MDSTDHPLQKLLLSIVIIILIFLFRLLIFRLIKSKNPKRKAWRSWRFNSTYISILLIIMLLVPLWFSSLRGILAILGIFGAGVLIVFKEILLNIIGWAVLIIRRPFESGHRITINNITGDVFEIRLMDFSMIEVRPRAKGGQSTGRILHLPNSIIFLHPLANASKEFSFNWNEIEICLTLNSDWKKAEKMILEIANSSLKEIRKTDSRIKHSAEEYSIQYQRLTPFIFVEVKEGHIVLNLRHLTEPRQTRNITDMVWRQILDVFENEKSIEFYIP